MGRFWAEETSERELDGEGRSSAGTAMASGGLSSVLGRFGRETTRTGSGRVVGGEGRGHSAWGAANRDGVASFAWCDERRRLELVSALREREEGEGSRRDGKLRGVREDKSADAEVRRDCRCVEAAPTSTVAGMAGELHSAEQEIHCFFV